MSSNLQELVEVANVNVVDPIGAYTTRETSLPYDHEARKKLADALVKLRSLENACKNLDKKELLSKLIDRIDNAQAIHIPGQGQEVGTATHYQLNDSVGGVTAKVSLIDAETFNERLGAILDNKTTLDSVFEAKSVDGKEVFKIVGDCNIKTNAIIKLPKADKNTEVQREAMALEIARILGFNTTESTFLSHAGKPALFVPFGDIRLLGDFASGDTEKVRLGISNFGDEYTDRATIQALGDGLYPTGSEAIEDFGRYLAYFYLCNDTDAIGKDMQNKALMGEHELYVFDQVLMSGSDIDLNHRLSLEPQGLKSWTRHGKARNCSLIDDSDFDEKYESISTLVAKKVEVLGCIGQFIEAYRVKINALVDISKKDVNGSLTKQQDLQYRQLMELLTDAKKLQTVLGARFNALDQLMNLFGVGEDLTKQAYVLEKLLNKPVLFAEDGRPYRHPHTDKHDIHIVKMNKSADTGKDGETLYEIKFNKKVDVNLLRHVLGQDTSGSSMTNTITLDANQLEKLSSEALFSRQNKVIQHPEEYLNQQSLEYQTAGYGNTREAGQVDDVVNAMRSLLSAKCTKKMNQRVELLMNRKKELQNLKDNSPNKGLIAHVQRQADHAIQAWLCQQNPDLQGKLNNAFKLAKRYDCVNAFHDGCLSLMKDDKPVNNYLESFIAKAEPVLVVQNNNNNIDAEERAPVVEGFGAAQKKSQDLIEFKPSSSPIIKPKLNSTQRVISTLFESDSDHEIQLFNEEDDEDDDFELNPIALQLEEGKGQADFLAQSNNIQIITPSNNNNSKPAVTPPAIRVPM